MIADCGVPLLGSSFNLTYHFTLEESVAVVSCDGRSNVATLSYIIVIIAVVDHFATMLVLNLVIIARVCAKNTSHGHQKCHL